MNENSDNYSSDDNDDENQSASSSVFDVNNLSTGVSTNTNLPSQTISRKRRMELADQVMVERQRRIEENNSNQQEDVVIGNSLVNSSNIRNDTDVGEDINQNFELDNNSEYNNLEEDPSSEGHDEHNTKHPTQDVHFSFEKYDDYCQDEEIAVRTNRRYTDGVPDIVANLKEQVQFAFPGSVKATDAGSSCICYVKCDVDSITILSTSLLKVVHRLGSESNTGRFQIHTKLNASDVDKSSRHYFKHVPHNRAAWRPRNKLGTSSCDAVRLRNFKNIPIGTVTNGSSKFFLGNHCV